MKKVGMYLVVVSLFLIVGCGPRKVSRETLNMLSNTKTSAEAAEAKLKELEKERLKLEEEKAQKEETVKSLEQELEALKRTMEGGE